MKTITLKPILLVCFGLAIATTVFAASLSYPSRPLNLRVTNEWNDGCDLAYDAPVSDGGSPVTGYLVEYKYNIFTSWKRINRIGDKQLEYRVDGMQEGRSARFRVSAINAFGISEPSEPSRSVEFVDPY